MSLSKTSLWVSHILIVGAGMIAPTISLILISISLENPFLILFCIPFISVFGIAIAFSPKKILLSKENLYIEKRKAKKITILLEDITSLKDIQDSKKEMGFTIRTFGASGVYGSFGSFWSKKIGNFSLYSTHRKLLLLNLKNNQKIIISPDNKAGLIKEILKQNKEITLLT